MTIEASLVYPRVIVKPPIPRSKGYVGVVSEGLSRPFRHTRSDESCGESRKTGQWPVNGR
jgi:hypothetical protein